MDFEKVNRPAVMTSAAHTIAQLKGRRLRMARALTGLSRQEIYEKIGIATSTMDTWESGRVELTERSSIRVCESLSRVGIYCSAEWLLTGEGAPPRIMDDIEKSMFARSDALSAAGGVVEVGVSAIHATKPKALRKIPPFLCENVKRELSFFINLHQESIFHIVDKNFLNSRYKIGDCVAAIAEDLRGLLNKPVIAMLDNGDTILCRLLSVSASGICSVFFSIDNPSEKIQIVKAGEIIWHRMIK